MQDYSVAITIVIIVFSLYLLIFSSLSDFQLTGPVTFSLSYGNLDPPPHLMWQLFQLNEPIAPFNTTILSVLNVAIFPHRCVRSQVLPSCISLLSSLSRTISHLIKSSHQESYIVEYFVPLTPCFIFFPSRGARTSLRKALGFSLLQHCYKTFPHQCSSILTKISSK